MKKNRSLPLSLLLAGLLPVSLANAQTPAASTEPVQALLDTTDTSSPQERGFTGTSTQVQIPDQVDVANPGVAVVITPGGEDYPGVHFKPLDPWNLSAFGHVEATVTNTGEKPVVCNLRIDGKTMDGEYGSNTETKEIKPGEKGTVKVYFGYTYGLKPGAKLDTSAIQKVVLFTHKSSVDQSFRIDSIVAGGPAGEKPPVDPKNVRVKPENGVLLGTGVSLNAVVVDPQGGAVAQIEGDKLSAQFPKSSQPQWVALKPQIGRWDFREGYGVTVKFTNTGANPLSLRVRVNSNSGPTDLAVSAPVAPNAEGMVEIPFAPAVPWTGIKDSVKTSWKGQDGTGTSFISDAVSGLTLSVDKAEDTQSVLVSSITLGKLNPLAIPEWVGKRPPVEGDWVMTFDENFEGSGVDEKKWNVYTENYWDKRSHFSKDNVIIGDGVAKLHYEKKTGFHKDDPSLKQTDYATGFLDTYGKWVQRYGYFEARMKLTSAPGLWPAFWLMPDRGEAAGPQWKRAATENGAMEFDIMEFLGRWGQYRYNIAMHWDGYGKNHQQTGTQSIYFQPDKDGFITAGLLWLPGQAVFYANGKEVARWETPRISNVPSDIMFTNVSGGWDNNAIDDSKLPDDFVIDYVRAWQRKDLLSEVDTAYPAVNSAAPTAKP